MSMQRDTPGPMGSGQGGPGPQGLGQGGPGPGGFRRRSRVGESVQKPVDLRFWNKEKAFPGYTLFAPKHYTVTYLIDMEGRVVNSWKSEYEPGQSVYLLENGHLLHCCWTSNPGFTGGGEGGRLEEYDWDGNLVWEFNYSSDTFFIHHDVEVLPNGNILAMAVEKKSLDECLQAGFSPDILPQAPTMLSPDYVIEIEKKGKNEGNIIWEWHVWDHLIQDHDRSKGNWGDVAAHPELVDANGSSRNMPPGRRIHFFWNHMNSIYYNHKLDQIMLSVRGNNEFWVIDHSTTTQQAKGHNGGKYGKGGDLLYRWGNPLAYRCGELKDQQLFQQHDAHWIPDNCPGAGHILLFNNGLGRPGTDYDSSYSSVLELVPPVDSKGNYTRVPGRAYGPEKPIWIYTANNLADFYSPEIAGAHRLPNGNTLICDGTHGVFFEVTPAGEKVWEYVDPVIRSGPMKQGDAIPLDPRGHQMNAVFKVHRYAPDYPGLAGKKLTPGKNITG